MKKYLIITILCLTNLGLSAQFSAGLTAGGGLNIKSVSGTTIGDINPTAYNYQLGLFVQYNFGRYYLQVTPFLTDKGSVTYSLSGNSWTSPKIHPMALSVSFGRKFFSGLGVFAAAGKEFNNTTEEIDTYGVDSKLVESGFYYWWYDNYSPFFMQLGASVDYKKYVFAVSFHKTLGINCELLEDSSSNPDAQNSLGINMLDISISYKIVGS